MAALAAQFLIADGLTLRKSATIEARQITKGTV